MTTGKSRVNTVVELQVLRLKKVYAVILLWFSIRNHLENIEFYVNSIATWQWDKMVSDQVTLQWSLASIKKLTNKLESLRMISSLR